MPHSAASPRAIAEQVFGESAASSRVFLALPLHNAGGRGGGSQGFGLAVLPADCLIDMATLGVFVNDPNVRLASERELKDLFPKCELGAMPPLGNLFNLPVIVDTSVDDQEFIAFNAGTRRDVIHMHTAYFERLANPAVARFAVSAVPQTMI